MSSICVAEGCGKSINSEKIVDYSRKNFGRVLCYECQQLEKGDHKPKTENKPTQNTSGSVDKDTLIIRQSSIRTAVELFKHHEEFNQDHVIKFAEAIEAWVLR